MSQSKHTPGPWEIGEEVDSVSPCCYTSSASPPITGQYGRGDAVARKKPNPSGSADRKRRGLRAILVPVTPEQHVLITRAAALADPPAPVTRWAAACLDAAARQGLADAGLPTPGE